MDSLKFRNFTKDLILSISIMKQIACFQVEMLPRFGPLAKIITQALAVFTNASKLVPIGNTKFSWIDIIYFLVFSINVVNLSVNYLEEY